MLFHALLIILLQWNVHSSTIFSLSQSQHSSYAQWKSQFSKSYQNGEVEAYRLALWVENYNKIELHNANYRDGLVSYYVALNQHSDYETEQVYSGLFYSDRDESSVNSICPNEVLENVSLKQYVPPVFTGQYQQQQCASGWAMATARTLSISYSNRARALKKSQTIFTFSSQQLLDCTATSSYNNNGCLGGSVFTSWQYLINIGSILENDYPYTSVSGACKASSISKPTFKISGCRSVPSNSQQNLRNAVSKSPVTIQINGNAWGFIYYSGGIYDGADCYQDSYEFNHALTVIGFDYQIDFDDNGQQYTTPYWMVSNSFGEYWGENGFMRMIRKEGETGPGPCGMYSYGTYPIL